MLPIRQTFQERMARFFKRRSPPCTQTTLTQRNIYIFLSKEGVMYGILLAITFIMGINYANNLVLGFCFFLASLFVITIHYTFSHLSKLQLKIVSLSNAQVGDFVEIRLQVSSDAKQPHRQIRLSFEDDVFSYQTPLETGDTGNQTPNLRLPTSATVLNYVKEPQTVSLWLPATERGGYELPRLTVSTVYPLGILQAWSYVYFEGVAWVYPTPLHYDMQATALIHAQNKEAVSGYSQAGQEDFDQLDSYVAGESLARISWGHLARGQGLLSKRFVDEVGQEQLLDYYQMPALQHEEKLRQLSFGIRQLSQSHVPFRLRLPDGEGQIGQGSGFEEDSLIRLAQTP